MSTNFAPTYAPVGVFSLFRVAVLFLLVVNFTSTLPAQASLSHPAVVSENPADTTPHIVLDSTQKVMTFEQIGRTMYAGGRFYAVQDPTMTTTYPRQNFVAFDADTGAILPLNLSFDGMVTGIEASGDNSALFISGSFSTVNGITRRGIAKYDLVNHRIDPTFAPKGMRTVSDIKLTNGALIAAGNFSKHLMAMDPTTGADLGTINITVAGVVNTNDETRLNKIAVSPDGTRLVATGNFATVNGQPRKRAFMLKLGATATLSTWYAPRFEVNCDRKSKRDSAQGVDFSPDGSYFVIVANGGTGPDGICDAAARFETANVSSTVEPTWINSTGGDTLWSVAVTGAAVYVGGHQRWLDNPEGDDFAGPGAVSRPGIGAIDPVTGLALPWNPTKSRHEGTRVLFATPDGLWVGSDGERFGHEDHHGIGFAPLELRPGSELVGNRGFEGGTSGWRGLVSSNTLAQVSGGHSGSWAVEVSNTVAGVNCGLDDRPNWVSVTKEGFYTASIWARSDTPGVTLKLRVREYLDGAKLGTVTRTLALTSSWQQVTANYTPLVAPGSTLDFAAYVSNAPAGVCFQADDASITFTPNNQ